MTGNFEEPRGRANALSLQHKALALLILAVEAFALFSAAGAMLFPLVICGAAFLGALMPRRYELGIKVASVLALLLAFAFFIKSRMTHFEFAYSVVFEEYATAYAWAQYFMALQVSSLFVYVRLGRSQAPSPAFVLFAIAAMACAGDYGDTTQQTRAYHGLSLVFAGLIALYCWLGLIPTRSAQMRTLIGRWGFAALLLLGTSVGAYGTNRLVYYYGPALDRWIISGQQPWASAVAFSRRATLDSVSRARAHETDAVALRIRQSAPSQPTADQTPGYLRGAAYETYVSPSWLMNTQMAGLRPAPKTPTSLPGRDPRFKIFQVRAVENGPWLMQDIHAASPIYHAFFAPLDTAYIGAELDLVVADDNGVIYPPGADAELYRNWIPLEPGGRQLGPAPKPDPATRLLFTQTPEDLDPRIRALAEDVTSGCSTSLEKIRAVEGYFRTNYAYSLDVTVPRGKEPLAYFLLERPPAYCEYFASGAAMLLRVAGVPCRYVNGFLVTERNPYGDYWVARNRDAHAWVEAYDDTLGWVIVEATPPDGIPSPGAASRVAHAWDAFQFRLLELRSEFREGLAQGMQYTWRSILLPVLRALAQTVAGWIVLILTCALVAMRLLPKSFRKRVGARDPRLAQFHRLRRKMDKRMAKLGFVRPPHETIHQFAHRLIEESEGAELSQQAAAWYLRYAEARYRQGYSPIGTGRVSASASLDLLEKTMPTPRR